MNTRSTIDYKGAETVNICIINRPGYIHTEAFREAAERIEEECRRRKISCKTNSKEDPNADLNIALGSHISPEEICKFSKEKSLVVNLERLEALPPGRESTLYLEILNEFRFIDFSSANISYCKNKCISIPQYLYRPWHEAKWNKVVNEVGKSWDICLIGSLTPRRKKIAEELKLAGLSTITRFDCYSCERDEILSKSRICLNIHAYEDNQTAEIWRLNYLAANQVRVISETCDFEKGEEKISRAITQVNYNDIIETAINSIKNESIVEREAIARKLYRITKIHDDANESHEYAENVLPKPTLINIGCGHNWHSDSLNIDITKTGFEDLVLDISDDWDNINRHVKTERFGDIYLNENGFDAIEATNVLEHISNLRQAITNMMRLIKPGGWLYIKFAHQDSLEAWDNPSHVRAINEHLFKYLYEQGETLDFKDMRATIKWVKFSEEEQGAKINKRDKQRIGTVESILVKDIIDISSQKEKDLTIKKIIEEKQRMGTDSLRESMYRMTYNTTAINIAEKPKGNKIPSVSLLTPTFGDRFEHLRLAWKWILEQNYPHELMEWVILTDTDNEAYILKEKLKGQMTPPDIKINIQSAGVKLCIGAKRNLIHKFSSGDILINIDDDDYYFPNRISHAVAKLTENPSKGIELAGCRYLPIFFTDDQNIWISDPGKNKACAGSFAYKRSLLKKTWYPEKAQNGEEIEFTQNWQIPIIDLDPFSTMVCIAHQNNTFDKGKLRNLFGDNDQEFISSNGIKYDGSRDFFKSKGGKPFNQEIKENWQGLYISIEGKKGILEFPNLFEPETEKNFADKLTNFALHRVINRNNY